MYSHSEIELAIDRVERAIVCSRMRGADPYDGLTSPSMSRFSHPRLRQAATQLVKHAPRGARRALRVPPIRMTKALSLFLRGYVRAQSWRPQWDHRIPTLVAEIGARQSPTGGWGYEFDVQTRWAFYPAGSSNIVVTAFAIEALNAADGMEVVSEPTWRWLAESMVTDHGYVRYVPDSDRLIHNANLLGARALARSEMASHRSLAKDAAQISVDRQRSDGSWRYGEGTGLEWVDNFHTVYVLSCLRDLRPHIDSSDAFDRGLSYWADTFMRRLPARYFAHSGRPIDLHNLASALLPFSWPEVGLSEAARDRHVDSLLSFQGRDGLFRKHAFAPSFTRWNNAHAFDALTAVRATHE